MKAFTSLSPAFLLLLVLGACTTAHVRKAVMTSGNMPRGLPRGTARRGIQGGMPPWSQGVGPCPARERELT